MDEEELKKLKEKKKKELQDQMEDQQEEQLEAMKQQQKKILRQTLTGDALERLGRVRLASPEVAQQLESYLVQLKQTGQIRNKITEDKLKQILKTVKDESKQDWNIKRR
ncbi:MAG: DNA-binding protein [Candidatus Aenigmatarchaeota archaeon]